MVSDNPVLTSQSKKTLLLLETESKYVLCTDRIIGRLGYLWKMLEQTHSPRKGEGAPLNVESA